MKKKISLLFALSSLFSCVAYAQTIQPLSFEHEDWITQCSNTGTCRIAGFHDESIDFLASILLTRHAGSNQQVTAEFKLDTMDEEPISRPNDPIEFYLNGQSLGKVQWSDQHREGKLNAAQTAALLAVAKEKARIEFKTKNQVWTVSDSGLTANLLKVDDFQKRLGTTGALIKKGQKSETNVLKPQPKIDVKKVSTSDQPYTILSPNSKQYQQVFKLLASQQPKEKDEIYCDLLDGNPDQDPDLPVIELYRLTGNKVLATMSCWSAAYNMGTGAWVLDQSLKTAPVFVTDSASDIVKGEILAVHKGRGIGDCFSITEWVWNGQKYIQTKDSWTGLCRGFVGGAWELKAIEADVR